MNRDALVEKKYKDKGNCKTKRKISLKVVKKDNLTLRIKISKRER